jgi:hypothetical protein
MSTRLLPQEYVKELREHLYVKNATRRVVNFTSEFKQLAYNELHQGKTMREIFTEAGFGVEKLGQKRLANFQACIEKAAQREDGFADRRSNNHRHDAQTDEAKLLKRLRQLEHQVAYLQQENDFLKKIEEAEKAVKKNCRRK